MTKAINIGELNRIFVGYEGENNARTININCQEWLRLFPGASISIYLTRHGESQPYGTGASLEGDILSWTPNSADTFYAGEGEAQVRLTHGNVIRKHKTVPAMVMEGQPGSQTTEIPAEWQSYVDQVELMKDTAQTARDEAEAAQDAAETARDAAEDAQTAAETAQGAAEDAQVSAQASALAAAGSATAAAASADSASGSAATATGAASSAIAAATSAGNYATSAAGSAEIAAAAKNNAVNAAASAGDSADEAQSAATSAQSSAGSASGSATTATNKAAEATTAAATATQKATQAGVSATNASNYASNAAGYASSAAGSASNASESKSIADAAKNAAIDAKQGAETAQARAETAQAAAETAQEAAEDAAEGIQESTEQIEQNRLDILSINQALATVDDVVGKGIGDIIVTTKETGSISGNVGTAISIGTQTYWFHVCVPVQEGELYNVSIKISGSNANENVILTDSNDIIVQKMHGKTGTAGDLFAFNVLIPASVTKMYIRSYNDNLYPMVYKIQKTISDIISNIPYTELIAGMLPKFTDYLSSATSGRYTGFLGDNIDYTESTAHKKIVIDVEQNHVYKIRFTTKKTIQYYVRVTDSSDKIIWINEPIWSEAGTVKDVYFLPNTSHKKIYIATHLDAGNATLAVFDYDLNSLFDAEMHNAYVKIFNLDNYTGRELSVGNVTGTSIGEKISINSTSGNYKHTIIKVNPGSICKVGYYARNTQVYGVRITDDDDVLIKLGEQLSGHKDNDWVEEIFICPENSAKLYITTYIGRSEIIKAVVIPEGNSADTYTYEDKIPSYYKEHIRQKADTINALMNYHVDSDVARIARDVEQFVFFTDYHYDGSGSTLDNTQNSRFLIEYILRHTGCGFVVHGGDIINNKTTQKLAIQYLTDFTEKFNDVRDYLYCCIGNHEYNNSENLSWAQVNKLINSRNERYMSDMDDYGDYYVDNRATKTRYIMMGCDRRETSDGQGNLVQMMSIGQIEFFLNTIKETPDGWSIILFIHKCLKFHYDTQNQEIIVDPDGVKNDGTLENWTATGKNIFDGIDALVSRGTFTYNSIQYDFTECGSTFICVFTGHSHYDANYTTGEGVPVIMTTTDCCPKRNTEYDWTNNTWIKGCTPGTVEEQAFDVVTVDKVNRKIYCTRVGYGQDREFGY